ncbi:hypothetical protein ACQKMI_14620 [Lysinibacillus sp. NPDC097214]|uniref:hypothetical protein n=1 Tax=Lysinibacillus sp. NPDC097214 TaxID=3390584 RepID=UPI003D006B03
MKWSKFLSFGTKVDEVFRPTGNTQLPLRNDLHITSNGNLTAPLMQVSNNA